MVVCPECGSVYWKGHVLRRVSLEYMEDGTHEVETDNAETIAVWCDECGLQDNELPQDVRDALTSDVLD